MSLVTSVVIVGHTPGGANLGTFPTLNFAPLSPCRCLRSFSSSLLSIRTMRMLILFDIDHQNPHIFSPPPTQVWMQFTYSLIGRSTMIPFLSRERERPNALVFIHYEYFRFKTAPPASVERGATAVRGVDSAPLRGFPIAGFNDVEHLYHEVSPHRHTQAFAPGRSSGWPGL